MTQDNTSLPAIREVPFHGARLLVQPGEGPESTLVAMKPVVEGIGLAWQPQHKKLSDHPVLSQGITEMVIPSVGGPQSAVAIPLNRLHFWLATLHPNKISDPAIREKVIIYQTEAADALFERFFGAAIHSPVTNNSIGRRVAAIIDDKIERAIGNIAPSLLRHLLAIDERAVAVGFKPALLVLAEKKVPSRRRRAFSQKVSARLRRFSADRGFETRISRESGRWLFQVEAINAWLASEGEMLIHDHLANLEGQGVLRLVRS